MGTYPFKKICLFQKFLPWFLFLKSLIFIIDEQRTVMCAIFCNWVHLKIYTAFPLYLLHCWLTLTPSVAQSTESEMSSNQNIQISVLKVTYRKFSFPGGQKLRILTWNVQEKIKACQKNAVHKAMRVYWVPYRNVTCEVLGMISVVCFWLFCFFLYCFIWRLFAFVSQVKEREVCLKISKREVQPSMTSSWQPSVCCSVTALSFQGLIYQTSPFFCSTHAWTDIAASQTIEKASWPPSEGATLGRETRKSPLAGKLRRFIILYL